jgi:hypothetical protein
MIGGKDRRKEPLGRPRLRWVENITKDLIDIKWGGVVWIDLARDRNR